MRTLCSLLSVLVSSMALITADAQSPNAIPNDAFVLTIDGQGRFYVNGDDAPLQVDESTLKERTGTVLRRDADTLIFIEAEAAAPRENVTRALQLLSEAGAHRIDIRTKSSPQQ